MERLTRRFVSPWAAGLGIGGLAVLAGTLGGLNPPADYGLCTTCHGRDLVVGLAQALGWDPTLTGYTPPLWPLLTTVGLVLGAWLGRRAAGEPAPRPAVRGWGAFLPLAQGFLVMSLALLAMGCPLRLTLRAADLSLEGGIGLAGVAAGVVAGTYWLKARA